MSDIPMPTEVIDWMRARNWGTHHLEWHVSRMWDILPPDVIAWAAGQGWKRNDVQEGSETNGMQFLAMHRVMIERLVKAFPMHEALFQGWTRPPTDPNDDLDPVPASNPQEMRSDMIDAIDRLHNQLATFDGEDGFGLFVETALRPFPNQPARRSTDSSSGLHNFMHNRFSDAASPVDMGNPEVNIENQQFWRLHGWIDQRWTAYRSATGRSNTDPRYLAILAAEAEHMPEHGPHHPTDAEEPRAAGVTSVRMPASIRSAILKALAER